MYKIVREAVLNTVIFLKRLWNSSPRRLPDKYYPSLDPSVLLPELAKASSFLDRKRSSSGISVLLPPIDITESGLEGMEVKRVDYGSDMMNRIKKGTEYGAVNPYDAIHLYGAMNLQSGVKLQGGMNLQGGVKLQGGMILQATKYPNIKPKPVRYQANPITDKTNPITDKANPIPTKPHTKTETMADLLLQGNTPSPQAKVPILDEDADKADNPFEESESESSVHPEADTKKTYMGMARRSYDGP